MTRKEKKRKALAEDKFLNSLPKIPRGILGVLKYNKFEIALFLLFISIVVILYILAFNVWYVNGEFQYKPQNAKDVAEAIKGK